MEAAEGLLSRGAVAAIWEGTLPAGEQPRLQVFMRLPMMRDEPGRYGSFLSDGAQFLPANLPASSAGLVRSGAIRRGTVVRLREFAVLEIAGDRYVDIKQIEVMNTDCEIIGNPDAYMPDHLQHQNDKLDVDSVASTAKLNCPDRSGGQGLNWHLTRGLIPLLQRPVFQVVGLSQLSLKLETYEKNRHIILSDGVYTLNAILSPMHNHLNLLKDNHLRKNTIVRLLKFNTILRLSLVGITQLEVLQTECDLIGSPKAYELCSTEKLHGLESKCDEPNSASAADCSCQRSKWYLTHGAVAAIMKGEMSVEQRPVMQVIDFSLMSQNGFSFYRILLSDGIHQVYVNLFPHLSHMVVDNYLQKGTRVRLLNFLRDNFGQDKKYMFAIAVELEVLDKECELIGNPTLYDLGNKEDELDTAHVASISLDDLVQLRGGQKELDTGHAAFISLDDLVQPVVGPHRAGQGMKCHLTRGIVAMLQSPVMQVVIVYPTRSELKVHGIYSLILSDGVHAYAVILVSKLNYLVKNAHIRGGTIIRLRHLLCCFPDKSARCKPFLIS